MTTTVKLKRIMIGCPTYGQNDSRFTTTLFMLAKYPGTELMMVRRSMPDKARNGLAEQLLQMKQDYLFFIDDDMTIEEGHPAALLDQLIQKMEADPKIGIIAPRAYKRTKPFYPCVFTKLSNEKYRPMTESGKGLVEVDAIHCAATLIRPSVFEKVKKPWFEFLKIGDVELGEDISFTRKAKDAGVKIVCHTDIQVQHISDPIIVDEETFKTYNAMAGPEEKVEEPPKPQIVRP
jgi:hypothetical protein